MQRGVTTLAAGTDEVDIELGEPVTVGESFVMVSARIDHGGFYYAQTSAELRDEKEGAWETLRIKRGFTGYSVTVSWQVFESDDLTVESGETSLYDEDSVDIDIDEVDLTSSFCVLTFHGVSSTEFFSRRPRGFLADEDTFTLDINGPASTTHYAITRWYVVEWSGIDVQCGQLDLTGASSSPSLDPSVDLTETFLLHNWSGVAASPCNRGMVMGEFTDDDEVTFEREDATHNCLISYFAISDESFSVQSGVGSTTGSSFTATIDPAVDTDESFWSAHLLGNGKVDTSSHMQHGVHLHDLQDSETLSVERTGTDGTLTSSWFVVEVEDIPAIVPPSGETLPVTDIEPMSA